MTDIPLPPYELRMGGKHFKKDADFIEAGVRDARLLRRRAGLGRNKTVLDWGCGAGRLAVGIKTLLGSVADYHGVDVQPTLVQWAQDNLADEHTRFSLVDQHNARYNPDGTATHDIPAEPGTVDVFHAYSVFSHMTLEDVAGYSHTIAGLLTPTGRAAVTAFVEDDVPDVAINPDGYLDLPLKGELHVVRFNRRFLEDLWWQAGLAVSEYRHGQDTDGQSLYVLRQR